MDYPTKYPYKVEKPDTRRAGKLAGKKLLFGEYSRFAVAPVHSRFEGSTPWFVWDAALIDEQGLAETIVIKDSFEEAMNTLKRLAL
jgi:hypothetical protein